MHVRSVVAKGHTYLDRRDERSHTLGNEGVNGYVLKLVMKGHI